MLFVAALALLNAVYELREKAVEEQGMKMTLKVLRGDAEIGLGGKVESQTKKKELESTE